MRLWCWPGGTFPIGELKILVATPDRMASLLELPEIARFHTRYLYHGLSGVLFRAPPIRSEHFETVEAETLDELTAAIRSSFHTVLMIEWDPALAAGLDIEERGRGMGRLLAALKRRAESSIVIVYAPAMDDTLQLVASGADQTVWLVSLPAPARPTIAAAARAQAQQTLF